MNNGITLLRCLLMYLIVLHHTICHTHLSTSGLLFPLFLLTIPAVDSFISISGWFGLKFSWRKTGSIVSQILYYAILSSAFSFPAAKLGWIENPIIALGNAWYGLAYLALLMIIPVINAGMEELSRHGKLKDVVLLISLLLTGDYFSRCMHLGFTIEGFGSHTFSTLLIVYMLAWALHKTNRYSHQILMAAFVVYFIVFCSYRVLSTSDATCLEIISAGSYNCPLVILSALGFVSCFAKLRVPKHISSFLTFIAPSMFPIYLIHDASPVGKALLVTAPIDKEGHTVLWSIVIFMVALLIDLIVRRFPLWIMKRFVIGNNYGK